LAFLEQQLGRTHRPSRAWVASGTDGGEGRAGWLNGNPRGGAHWDDPCDRAIPIGHLNLGTSFDRTQMLRELILQLRHADTPHGHI
jgi:hypothetical protein